MKRSRNESSETLGSIHYNMTIGDPNLPQLPREAYLYGTTGISLD